MAWLLLALLLLLPVPVSAQGVGLWSRPDCTTITSPVAGSTACLDTTRGVWLNYDGTGWQSDVARATSTVNVRDPRWGAKGDGVTDDTSAIQAAITAASSDTDASRAGLHFPAGTYSTTNELTLDLARAMTITTGGSVTIRYDGAVNATRAVLRMTTAVRTSNRLTVSGAITFDANSRAGYALAMTGTIGSMQRWDNVVFQNATVTQALLGAGMGDDISQIYFDRVQFAGNAPQNVVLNSSNSYTVTCFRCAFTSTGTSVINHIYNQAGNNFNIEQSDFGNLTSNNANTASIRTADTIAIRNSYTEDTRFLIVDGGLTIQKMVILDNIFANDSRDTAGGVTMAGTNAIRVDGSSTLWVSNVFLAGVNATVNNRHRNVVVPAGTQAILQNAEFENGSATTVALNSPEGRITTVNGRIVLNNMTGGTPSITFRTAATNSNFRIASQDNFANQFEITRSTAVGGTTFTTPIALFGGGVQIGAPTGGDQGAGTINAATSYYINGTVGLTVTKTVRAAGGAADCTLIFTSGLLTGGTC